MSVVGFDIGHQSCFIAAARQGGIEVVANEFSDRRTPTCVAFGDKQRFMGNDAKSQIVTNSKNAVWGWKKLVGRMYNDPQVQHQKTVLPFDIVEGQYGTAGIQVHYLGETQILSPQQVTAAILTKLKATAEIALKTKVVDCVINVPCYYTDVERRAMLDAAYTAGLNVLRLMNDTTATALSYGIYKQDLPAPEEKSTNVVFVDMGHSDLQVAVCAFNKGKLKVLASVADPNLGGFDFDLILMEHFIEEFKKKYKLDANKKLKAKLRLLAECEKMKKLMSANSTELPIGLECFMEDKDVSGRMNRDTLEELAVGLLDRARQTMQGVLDAAKLKKEDIHSVEIVGGSTRVPAIKEAVKAVFGKDPSTTLNADEAVARGCALQCAILSPTFRVRDFSITDVQPYPITLKWESTSMDEESEMEIFERNHPAPFSKMLTFYRDNQFSLEAKYSCLQDLPYPDTSIGEFTVKDVVPQVEGESAKVKVKVRVNIHGIFTVSSAARIDKVEKEVEVSKDDKKTPDKKDSKEEPMDVENGPTEQNGEQKADEAKPEGEQTPEAETPPKEETMETEDAKKDENAAADDKKEKKTKIVNKSVDLPVISRVPSLSKEQLNLYIEKEGYMIQQDKLEKERADAKNAVEEYVYDMRDKLYSSLEQYITEAEKEAFSKLLTDTEDWLYDEGEDQNKQVYVDKLAEMKKFGNPVKTRYDEAQTRPAAFEELGKALMLVRKACDAYAAKDEKYRHLEQADMDKVVKCLQEKTEWYEKNQNSQQQRAISQDPAVTTSQITSQRSLLESTCKPILSKPKPKPKEEPPKDNGKDAKAEKKKGEGDSKKEEEAPKAESSEQAKTEEDKIDMELD